MSSKFNEYVSTKIKGAVSTSHFNFYDNKILFNDFLEFLNKKYSFTQSFFDYKVYYQSKNENKIETKKDYLHYVLLDNNIYVEIETTSIKPIDDNINNIDNDKVRYVIAYSSQSNNTQLLNFMNNINKYVLKNNK
jgi:hypothetical protein